MSPLISGAQWPYFCLTCLDDEHETRNTYCLIPSQYQVEFSYTGKHEAEFPECFRQAGVLRAEFIPRLKQMSGGAGGPISLFPDWGNTSDIKVSHGLECCLQATEDKDHRGTRKSSKVLRYSQSSWGLKSIKAEPAGLVQQWLVLSEAFKSSIHVFC